ncbi:MAG: DUF460 domain-containing protein [Candidatus Micrarchaeia archaeon]
MKLIVGIDPGATVGMAALDLSGRTVALVSGRGWGKEEIIARLRGLGTPALLACDVRSPPELVLKLASAFNTHLYVPDKDLREEEKRELARGTPCANEHEMDALAAARKAFHSVENKLRQVAKALRDEGLEAEEESAKALVLSGTSVSNVLALLKARRLAVEVRAGEIAPQRKRSIEEEVERIVAELEAALKKNDELTKMVERLEAQLLSAREELERARSGITERLRREAELLKREAEIRRLRRTIASLRRREFLKSLGKKKAVLDLEKIISEYRRS